MNELNKRKPYLYAIENYAGIPPFSNVKLAHIIYMVGVQMGDKECPSVSTVKRWYQQCQSDKRLVIPESQGRLACKH
ncbi:hypothetical protein H4J50_16165 [Colwellia sp. 6M3]|uniref:hypothetical protein n=1 Tax=Colwellia sp. 6M3 TaxID=2759849 RepID=UPI0015F6414C|nr:hypothetical protein [Colwellia sp. 6M3]MBA6417546.1 hypothetical protein [Colwellia sp. 6M3]|tara:strand:+ start:2153 stop:2383 length:231 start_codon:yes stop_codon:yes gene_type:complete